MLRADHNSQLAIPACLAVHLPGLRLQRRQPKQIVEPVFGQVQEGFRQFRLRGIGKVKDEWALNLHRPQPRQARQGDMHPRKR